MMYQIQLHKKEEGSSEHTLRFNASHEVFAAHFPGSPIVPGAVLIDVVRSVASEVFGKNMRVTEVKNVKFITVIIPKSEEDLKIVSRYSVVEDGYLFKSVISGADCIFAKFDVLVKEA